MKRPVTRYSIFINYAAVNIIFLTDDPTRLHKYSNIQNQERNIPSEFAFIFQQKIQTCKPTVYINSSYIMRVFSKRNVDNVDK